jgi:hypothetical protein
MSSDHDSSSITRASSDARSGLARKIVVHPWFEPFSSFLIFAYTAFQGVEEDYNFEDGEYVNNSISAYLAIEWFFTIALTFEIALRILAWPSLKSFLMDRDQKWWNRIDFYYLIIINFETWILPVILDSSERHHLRPLRLLRLLRIARIFQMFPSLMVLVSSIALALAGVALIVLLEACFMWFMSVIYVNWARSDSYALNESENPNADTLYYYFGSCSHAMLTFLQILIQDDVGRILRAVGDTSVVAGIFLILFSAISVMLFFNLLIGSICRVVFENTARKRDSNAANAIRKWLKRSDRLRHGWITEKEWERGMRKIHRYNENLDISRLETCRFLSTTIDPETQKNRIDIFEIPNLYAKLSRKVQTQDILSCQTELDSLYALIEEDLTKH